MQIYLSEAAYSALDARSSAPLKDAYHIGAEWATSCSEETLSSLYADIRDGETLSDVILRLCLEAGEFGRIK
jgi:hypothetical protein